MICKKTPFRYHFSMFSIAMINKRGGAGKTTAILALADAIQMAGRRAMILDLDPEGTATWCLQQATSDILSFPRLQRNSRYLEKILIRVTSKLSLAPANPRLLELSEDFLNCNTCCRVIEENLAGLQDRFDYGLFDTAPGHDLVMQNALTAADLAILPVQAELFAIDNVRDMLAWIATSGTGCDKPPPPVKILVTNYDADSPIAQRSLNELRDTFGPQLWHTVVPRDHGLTERFREQKPMDFFSRGTVGYLMLTQEIFNYEKEQTRKRAGNAH